MLNNQLITFSIFEPYPKLVCVFSTRANGYSTGIYHGLNLGLKSGDLPERIKKNRRAFFRQLSLDENAVAYAGQVHSANVTVVTEPGIYAGTDALIGRGENTFLAVVTADCFPVFLYHPSSPTVAVIHAGWRGTQAGIIENTLQVLNGRFNIHNQEMLAAIGPGLQRECFEIGEDVIHLFAERYLAPHADPGKKYLDLQRIIFDKLLDQGLRVENIAVVADCTMCQADKYYSYRRDGKQSGRMMGIIGIRE